LAAGMSGSSTHHWASLRSDGYGRRGMAHSKRNRLWSDHAPSLPPFSDRLLGNSTFYGDMSVWGGVAVILATLSAVDWARRRGHTIDRYPALQRATSLVFRLGRLALAVITGITLVAILMRLFGLS
jgi:hypothetical protein